MTRKKINILLFVLGMLFLNMNNIYAQAVDIELQVSNSLTTRSVFVGLDITATNGIDPSLGEASLPPMPPASAYEVRFDLSPYGSPGVSTYRDYRNAPSFPFTDSVSHRLFWQLGNGGSGPTINYNLTSGVTMRIKDEISGSNFNSGVVSGSGSYTVPVALTAALITMYYNNVSGVDPGPTFSVSPASLTFPPTAVGGSNTLPVTVSNPGTTNALIINGITSSDPQFTFAPNTFPVNVPAGGNTVFNVTFSPTSLGNQTANLEFIHNAPGSPTSYSVQGVGADAGPTFAVSTDTLDFGNTGVGDSDTLQITVLNNGLTNPLNISNASASPSQYTVSPATANIPALGSQVFNVVFSPTAAGVLPGTLTFTHNAPGSPSSVALTGNGIATFGLIFAEDTLFRKEDSTYTDVIQLKALNATAHAIQFRLLVNKTSDDNTILTFLNIEKGADVSASNWSLQYEVFRGPLQANGASVDSIYVLLYDLNQNGGLVAADYDSLLKVRYRVADLPALVDTSKSSLRISNAEASTFQGFPINITPSRDELSIFATNRVSSLGDVNGDGSLDILDLIFVVDHILGRDSLDSEEFARADIAPWTVGNATPDPDGFVNVQDLSLIQNIILTGVYPDGTTLNKPGVIAQGGELGKSNSPDAKVIFYITNEGIAVRLDSKVAIRGAQLEFDNIADIINNMIIDSRLGDGYYAKVNELLRVLLYDNAGNEIIDAGVNFVANLPFTISDPEEISVDKIILVDTNKEKLLNIQIEIIYGNAPELPVDYSLFQNYPNPFNPNTIVRFSVPQTNLVNLTIYNALGEEVRTLFLGQVERGTYAVQWDGKDNAGSTVTSGMYIYKMTAGSFSQSKKMMFIK